MTEPTGMQATTSALEFVEPADSNATGFVPTAALLVWLIAAQHAGSAAAIIAVGDAPMQQVVELRLAEGRDIFDELLDFHQRLISTQIDLPEEAAQILRANPWHLYD